MTERQKALLENLPKCNNNVSKAALMSGYSNSYANKRIHNYIGNCRKPILEPAEKVKARYLKKVKKLQKKMFKDKDNTNLMRSVEIEGKVEGLFKETVVNEGNTKDITIVYGNNPLPNPNDNPSSINDNHPSISSSINQGNEINNHKDNDTKPVSIDLAIGKIEDREGGGIRKG